MKEFSYKTHGKIEYFENMLIKCLLCPPYWAEWLIDPQNINDLPDRYKRKLETSMKWLEFLQNNFKNVVITTSVADRGLILQNDLLEKNKLSSVIKSIQDFYSYEIKKNFDIIESTSFSEEWFEYNTLLDNSINHENINDKHIKMPKIIESIEKDFKWRSLSINPYSIADCYMKHSEHLNKIWKTIKEQNNKTMPVILANEWSAARHKLYDIWESRATDSNLYVQITS
jgi:hypothetical protein